MVRSESDLDNFINLNIHRPPISIFDSSCSHLANK